MKYITVVVASLWLVMLTACEKQPETREECVLKYAKPGMDSDLGHLAIRACIAQNVAKEDEIVEQNTQQYNFQDFDFTKNTGTENELRGERANSPEVELAPEVFRIHIALAVTLAPVMLLWSIIAWIARSITKGQLKWHFGTLSFFCTWILSALINGQPNPSEQIDGTSTLLFFGIPIATSLMTLLPILHYSKARAPDN